MDSSIAALDTENEIIIFSKSKTFDPIKLNFDSYSSLEFADDEKSNISNNWLE